MELVDEIMEHIGSYVTDHFAVSNSIYIILDKYEIKKKSTEIVKYKADTNEMLIKKFLVSKKIKGCTDRTIDNYKKNLEATFERLRKNAVDIKIDDLRVWIAYRLRDNVKKVTVSNEIRVMSSFFTWLYGEGIITKNPMVGIETVKQPKTKKNAFTDDEIVTMRNELRTTKEKCIFEMLLSTGCRVTELVSIKISDINEDASILVHGKGQKDRYVYLNATARFAVDQYMRDRKDGSIWLFPRMVSIEKTGKRGVPQCRYSEWYKDPKFVNGEDHADKGTIECFIRKLGRKVGVDAYPHKFRRTCATNALRNGMPIEMVSKMLGHEQLSTTQIYLDISDESLKYMHEKYVR